MKNLLLAFLSVAVFSCNSTKEAAAQMTRVDYANSITANDIKTKLYIIAGDEMEGRMTGSDGQKKASAYIKDFYKNQGISAPAGITNYSQPIPESYFGRMKEPKPSENIVAFIKGSEKPDEIIVLSAHYDHVGTDKDGNGPKRSILFLHVTGEEIGLYGSRYYTDNPIFPLANTVVDLNTDMIGRIDPDKADNPNYIYLIGSEMLSKELKQVSEDVNKQYANLELDYKYDDPNDKNRFYYRSDHYNFAKNNVPIIFYFNGVHEDYHKMTDTPDKIEYDLMTKRTKLIFQTAWEIANRENRIVVDKVDDKG